MDLQWDRWELWQSRHCRYLLRAMFSGIWLTVIPGCLYRLSGRRIVLLRGNRLILMLVLSPNPVSVVFLESGLFIAFSQGWRMVHLWWGVLQFPVL